MVKRFISKEKENNLGDAQQQNEESLRQQDIFLIRRVRERLQQTQRNVSKLYDNLRLLRRCTENCIDIVEDTVCFIERERQETRRILTLVEQDDPSSFSSRRHTVNPMIAGYTLKMAKISLKRLAPKRLRELEGRRICNMLQDPESEQNSRVDLSNIEHQIVQLPSSSSDSEPLASDEESSLSSISSS